MPSVTGKIVIGISGASGAAYAQRLIQQLIQADRQVHLVVSPMGQRLLHEEMAMTGIDLHRLAGLPAGRDLGQRIVLYPYRDVGAAIASGSFLHDGMVIVPCSSNSLSAVATGSSQNLLHRAAQVTLKERRKLLLVHREMPLGLVDIRNMALATEAGAILCPANPGFYMHPRTIDDLVDFIVGRLLDLLDVPHQLAVRWPQQGAGASVSDASCDETSACEND